MVRRLPPPRSLTEQYLGAVLDELEGLRSDIQRLAPPAPDAAPAAAEPEPVKLEEPLRPEPKPEPARKAPAKKTTPRKRG